MQQRADALRLCQAECYRVTAANRRVEDLPNRIKRDLGDERGSGGWKRVWGMGGYGGWEDMGDGIWGMGGYGEWEDM